MEEVLPVGESIVDEPEIQEERVIIPRTIGTQTEKRVSQKQLDALAKGRALNIERRKTYIEFEKLQKLQALQPPTPPPVIRATPVPQSYSLSFV